MSETKAEQIKRLQGNELPFYRLPYDDRKLILDLDEDGVQLARKLDADGWTDKPINDPVIALDVYRTGQPPLSTPVGIKFWTTDSGIVLGMLFNEGKQYLKYHQFDGVYEVHSAKGLQEVNKVQECLPLTPCKYEDLKPGEFSTTSPNFTDVNEIRLNLPNGEFVFQDNGMDIMGCIGAGIAKNQWRIG